MRTKIVIPLFLVILLKCHISYALNCYSCIGDCKTVTSLQCKPEEVCMIREMYADGVRQGQQKGCLNAQMCNSTSAVESFRQWCCNMDLCNTEIPQPGGPMVPAPTSKPSVNATKPPVLPLMCYSCDYMCITNTSVRCAAEEVCVTKSATFAGMTMRKYGCTNSSVCNTQTSEEVERSLVKVSNYCCTSNLCNSAATPRLPVFTAIGGLLFLWIAKLS
ncbi:uncharacterized protein PAF06_002719 [Gastrophryne carolinensis]